MTRSTLLILLSLSSALWGCSAATTQAPGAAAPGLSFPARVPESTPSASAAKPPLATEESNDRVTAPEPNPADLPDPPALMLAHQWEYELLYDRGEVSVVAVRPLLFEQPVATARRIGRYAVELWIGRELIDRVRFDFPGLAAENPSSGPRRPLDEPPDMASGAVASRTILVPDSPRATRAFLVDRALGTRTRLPWPPDAPLDPAEPAPDREPDN